MRQLDFSRKNWKKYQKSLKRKERIKHYFRRLPLLWIYAGAAFIILVSVAFTGPWIYANLKDRETSVVTEDIQDEMPDPVRLVKADLHTLLENQELMPSPITGEYGFFNQGATIEIKTSIDSTLQSYIHKLLTRSMTIQAAVVVIKPESGKVLAMASYSKDEKGGNKDLYLRADIPAASLFKIVSAAVALEAKNYSPDHTLYYRGGKYTLYKSQLKELNINNKYTYKTSLRKAFSGSNNPVFGRLGIYDLGKELMAEYADRFMFNHPIPFDLPLEVSRINVPDDDFGLAEIASGFNKQTLISPLHAALMVSAIVNNGAMMEPWLVEEIQNEKGETLYGANPSQFAKPIKQETAEKLKILMMDTVKYGTCSKAFRSLRSKKLFKNIELGAKSGTINDPSDTYKYDWLAGFALPMDNKNGICIAVLAIHGKLLGIRAKDLVKEIINYHFYSLNKRRT